MQNQYTLDGASSSELIRSLSERVRQRRLEKGMSRKSLSDISGVPVPTISRFENQHAISLQQFLDLTIALGYAEEAQALLSEAKYSSMEELEQIRQNKERKHGRRIENK